MASDQPLVGQRFRDVQARFQSAAWVLSAIFTGSDGIEYATLTSISDATTCKTLSLAVMADTRRFLRVADPAEKTD